MGKNEPTELIMRIMARWWRNGVIKALVCTNDVAVFLELAWT